jgi:hypothetical protein
MNATRNRHIRNILLFTKQIVFDLCHFHWCSMLNGFNIKAPIRDAASASRLDHQSPARESVTRCPSARRLLSARVDTRSLCVWCSSVASWHDGEAASQSSA